MIAMEDTDTTANQVTKSEPMKKMEVKFKTRLIQNYVPSTRNAVSTFSIGDKEADIEKELTENSSDGEIDEEEKIGVSSTISRVGIPGVTKEFLGSETQAHMDANVEEEGITNVGVSLGTSTEAESSSRKKKFEHADESERGRKQVNPRMSPEVESSGRNKKSVCADESERGNNEGDKMGTAETSLADTGKSLPDASLKHLSAKYTCIGPAQQIMRPATLKPPTSASSPSAKQFTSKHTEKFVVRNISKATKVYKVSNLNYKIKPVRKNLSGKTSICPLIYIGEPTFGDLDDFYTVGGMDSSKLDIPLNVKEEDLYDITKLRNSFMPTENFVQPAAKSLNPYRLFSCPNMNNLAGYQSSPSPNFDQFFIPPNQFSYTPDRNFNAGSIIRIVARTIPSATLASHANTTSKLVTTATASGTNASKICPISLPPTAPGGFVKMPNKNRKIVPIHKFSTKASPVTIVMPPGMHSLKSPPSLPRKNGPLMTMKFMPTSQQSSAQANTTLPVKIVSSQMLPKLSTSVTVESDEGKVLSALVFVPSDEGLPIASTSKTPIAEQENRPLKTPASKALAKFAHAAKPEPVTPLANIYSSLDPVPSSTTVSAMQNCKPLSSRPLREGVEVTFEDGVRHFITSLKQMTYLDDEPVKHWSDLKKGTKVTAKWTDGLIYDATVVGCYFAAQKQLQPVVQLHKLVEKSTEKTTKCNPCKVETIAGHELQHVGCTQCRAVFSSIASFRQHQKRKCRSPGIMVPKNASRVTDSMVKASRNDNNKDAVKSEVQIRCSKRKAECDRTSKPARKKQKFVSYNKDKPMGPKITLVSGEIFKEGTRFLHRWQLDDGRSKWYEGQVISVVSVSKAFLDREFEVSYKGESENYFLKLYEDYPADIRIMGKA